MRKLIPALAGGIIMLGMNTASHATEWIDCSDATEKVQIGVLAGSFDFLNITRARLRVGEFSWSTDPSIEPGQPLATGQRFFGEGQLLFDLEDPDTGEVLAQLRAFVAEEGQDYVQGGTLRVAGHGAWVVSCEGP